jgi:hypothetical protein
VRIRYLLLAPLLLGAACAAWAADEQVLCHVDYGGETRELRADATRSPYTVAPVSVGSYFLFRIVFEREPAALAAVKLYTYADRDEGAVPIHVAEFPLPLAAGGRFGFTGMQRVYEPVRDGELEYWCQMVKKGAAR